MKKGITLIFILAGLGCNNIDGPGKLFENLLYDVKEYEYTSMSIPEFFQQLVLNHRKDYYQFSSNEYTELCKKLDIDETNESNKQKYFQIKILHDLFTSKSADNCSVGEVWKIPYQWHWIKNNPRHKIYLKETNELLKEISPGKEFKNYHSYAICGDFSTFGWCSEREMAFTSLLTILNYKGKVKSEKGHSWSELIIGLTKKSGNKESYKVKIDNTFDKIEIASITNSEIRSWEADMGNSKNKKWYNEKALSKIEQEKISNFMIAPEVMKKLEKKMVRFLNKKI